MKQEFYASVSYLIFMKLFFREKCNLKTFLTIFDKNVVINTDSEPIHNFLNILFGSCNASSIKNQNSIDFFISINCLEPWFIVMATPDYSFVVLKTNDKPSQFNVFKITLNKIETCSHFSLEDVEEHDPFNQNSTIELFINFFKIKILDYLLSEQPWIRLMHAASVSHNNSGLLFIAPSKGGKTTLSLACTLAGMKFLSDDHIFIDLKKRLILPFPKSLRLREKLYLSLPEFKSIPSSLAIENYGNSRYYIHPEDIRKDAIGEPVKLTHLIVLKDIKEQPFICETDISILPEILIESDCISVENPLELVWQWMPILDNVKLLELYPGNPLQTAKFILQYLESEKV